MVRRSKTRLVVRWGGTLACALFLVAFVVSRRWYLGEHALGSSNWSLGLARGSAVFWWLDVPPPGDGFSASDLGWDLVWELYEWRWAPRAHSQTTFGYVIVPLWLPLVVLAVPTTMFWFCDRWRIRPGHCRACGYDLTGNVSGRCPECGTATGQGQVGTAGE